MHAFCGKARFVTLAVRREVVEGIYLRCLLEDSTCSTLLVLLHEDNPTFRSSVVSKE